MNKQKRKRIPANRSKIGKGPVGQQLENVDELLVEGEERERAAVEGDSLLVIQIELLVLEPSGAAHSACTGFAI